MIRTLMVWFAVYILWPLPWILLINWMVPPTEADVIPRSLFVSITLWMVTFLVIGAVLVYDGWEPDQPRF